MKELITQLIGEYTPVQVSETLYIDIPYLICGILVVAVIYSIIKGVFYVCTRH